MKQLKKKILIADSSTELLSRIKHYNKASSSFHIETTTKGSNCLNLLHSFKPDLLVIDFMLPEVHGIEILKTIKTSPLLQPIGVILTGYHIMVQNYHAAAHLHADYFLEKPFSVTNLFHLIHLFFKRSLQIAPLSPAEPLPSTASSSPSFSKKSSSYVKFWGTRGSNPVAGSEYIQFGGNTPCLEVRHQNDLVIFDAGSGIRALGQDPDMQLQSQFHILISHTHWDHLLGFPFFYPMYQGDKKVHIWTPVGFEKNTKDLFSEMLNYSYFPVSLDDIKSKLLFQDLRDSQTLHFGNIRVFTHYAFHPGATLCFKIEIEGKKIGYVTDNEFLQGCTLTAKQIELKQNLFTPYLSLINFLKGCDILIHEAQYFSEEYVKRIGWGHSSILNASLLIKKAEIKHWIVIHHDPRHTDEILLKKYNKHLSTLQEIDHECLVQFAFDGLCIPLDA
jgi:ribonuclease BN (tRNA processing enzyme)/DNA-binding NarL/FixJ family response regulator